MEPLTDVRDISRIAYGFIASKALFAALELDLFSRLLEPKTIDAVARAAGIPAHRVKTLLATLTALGLIVRNDDRFRNSPASERYLARGSPASFGEYYRLQINRQAYPALEHLDAGLAGDSSSLASDIEALLRNPVEAEVFSVAQHAASLGPAISSPNWSTFTAAGRCSMSPAAAGPSPSPCAWRYPQLAATIIDFPNVIDVARRFIAGVGLSERIQLAGGNALDTSWPDNQDVVLVSYLLSAVKDDDIPRLLASAYRSLRPGGLVQADACPPDASYQVRTPAGSPDRSDPADPCRVR